MPEAARQHERVVEPKRRLDAAAEDIVLSPRVVDRLAFDEYVKLLRAEIEGAARESELLARRAEAGAVVLEQLERFMGDNGDAIEHAAEILAGIDQRMSESRRLLDQVDRRAANLSKASEHAEQAIEARAEAFQQRLRSIVDTAMDRFEETEDQLTARAASARRELLDRLEQMRSRGEETLARLDTRAAELSAEAEDAVTRAQARLDTLRGPARELLQSLETRAASLDVHAAEQETRLKASARGARADIEEAHGFVLAERAALATMIADARSFAETLGNDGAAIAAELRAQRDALLDEMGERAASVVERGVECLERAAATHAEAIATATKRAADAERSLRAALKAAASAAESGELRDAVARCAKAKADAATTAKQVASLDAQAATARSALAEAITEGAQRIDALDLRVEGLRNASSAEADRLATLLEAVQKDGEPSLVERVATRVRQQTRGELHDELEMATASLAALSERVRALEAASVTPKAEGAAPKPAPAKPRVKKPAAKKPAAKKAASGKQASNEAPATTKTQEMKPARGRQPDATAEAKPSAIDEPSPKPAA